MSTTENNSTGTNYEPERFEKKGDVGGNAENNLDSESAIKNAQNQLKELDRELAKAEETLGTPEEGILNVDDTLEAPNSSGDPSVSFQADAAIGQAEREEELGRAAYENSEMEKEIRNEELATASKIVAGKIAEGIANTVNDPYKVTPNRNTVATDILSTPFNPKTPKTPKGFGEAQSS